MVENAPVIETFRISKNYGLVEAVKDLTVSIPQGGTVGLLGPNGAGKSTTIKLLLGLVNPSLGEGKVLGMDIRTKGLEIRDRVGYMPEHDCFIGDIDAVKYVMHLGRMNGMSVADALRRAHEVLYYVGLGESRYRKIETFSLGMKQRVKLAQALVHDPELLILDEPTTGMDPDGRIDMLELIKDIAKCEDKTLVMCSHILADVERVCDRVVIMNRGKLVRTGSLKELVEGKKEAIILRVKGDSNLLIDKFEREGISAELRDDAILVFAGNNPSIKKKVMEIMAEAKMQLRYFGKPTASLEDLFLSTISYEEEAEREKASI